MVNQLVELYLSGLNVNQIANKTGVYNRKVKKLLQEAGVYGAAPEKMSNFHEQIVQMCDEGLSYQAIADRLSTTVYKIVSYCKRHNLYERVRVEVTPDLEKEVLKLYREGMSSRQIAKRVNASKVYVLGLIPKEEKRTKTSYNIYSCNYQFFENIDSEAKAYFLGLFYADGYNGQSKGTVKLGFAEKDKELLYKFLEVIESNHPIKTQERGGNVQTYYKVDITSKVLSNDLAKHGCVQAKSLILETIPNIPEELYRHFIRGHFDGDGSVFYSKSGLKERLLVNWTGNKPFLESVRDYLIKVLDIHKNSVVLSTPEVNLIGNLRYSNETATKIHDWLYADCQYYLERKKNAPKLIKETNLEIAKECVKLY